MGGHDSEIGADDAAHRARERVLPSAVDPAHEQAAGPQDRGVDPLRARRRRRRAAARHRARGGAASQAIGAGRPLGALIDAIPRRGRRAGAALRASRIARLLGQAVPADRRRADSRAARLRGRARADGTKHGRSWVVTVPTFRVDVAREADLIEEVGRHYGFDRLPITFPALTAPQPPPPAQIAETGWCDRCSPRPDSRNRRRSRSSRRRRARRSANRASSRPPSPIRCRRSSPCCGRRCCPVWSTRARTTAAASGKTSACSRPAAGSPATARDVPSRSSGAAPPTAPHWSAPDRAVDFFDAKGVVEAHLRGGRGRRRVRTGERRIPRPRPCRRAVASPTAAATVRSASSANSYRRSPKLADSPAPKTCSSAELDLDALASAAAATDRARRIAAALSVDRPRHLDARRRCLACRHCSWHYPFGGSVDAGLDRRIRSLPGQRRA